MKTSLPLLVLLLAGAWLTQGAATGHGGTYRGPGDIVPPNGGGSGTGSTGGTPAPTGPTGPGSGTGGTGGTGTSGTPGDPRGLLSASTGLGQGGADLTEWTFWWEFNKDPYLDLKSHIHAARVQTGSPDFFLGYGQGQNSRDSLRPSDRQIRDQVVPTLLAALESERDNDIVTACLLALAKIGDERAESGKSEFEKVLVGFLADPSQEIAETAAVSLGVLANPASIPTLRALLEDTPEGRKAVGSAEVDYRTRAFAAYGLGLISRHTSETAARAEIVRSLFGVLRSDDTRTKDVRVACVIALGLAAADEGDHAPLELRGDGEATAARPSIETRTGQIRALLEYLEDRKNQSLVRAHVPTALARLCEGLAPESHAARKAEIGAALLAHVAKSSGEPPEVVQSCILALGLFGDDDNDQLDAEIRKVLIAAPTELADAQARCYSRIALAHAASRPGKGREPGAAIAPVSRHFLDQLARPKSPLGAWNALAAGIYGRRRLEADRTYDSSEIARALRTALGEVRAPLDVGATAIALGILRDPEASVPISKLLREVKDDQARGYCCLALGLLGAQDAARPIQELIQESQYRPELLRQAAVALGLLGDKNTVKILVGMLDQAKSLASQASITSALGFIGDRDSIEPLLALLTDEEKTSAARGFAAAALGIVADKERLPWNSKIAVDLNYRAATDTLTRAQDGTGILDIL